MNGPATSASFCAQTVPRDHVVGHVYFLTCEAEGFPIKIGFSADPKMRVMQFALHMPYTVTMLAVMDGSRATERAILRHFKKDRLRGEWFKRTPELLAAIERVKAGKFPYPSAPRDPKLEKHLAEIRKMDFSEVGARR